MKNKINPTVDYITQKHGYRVVDITVKGAFGAAFVEENTDVYTPIIFDAHTGDCLARGRNLSKDKNSTKQFSLVRRVPVVMVPVGTYLESGRARVTSLFDTERDFKAWCHIDSNKTFVDFYMKEYEID